MQVVKRYSKFYTIAYNCFFLILIFLGFIRYYVYNQKKKISPHLGDKIKQKVIYCFHLTYSSFWFAFTLIGITNPLDTQTWKLRAVTLRWQSLLLQLSHHWQVLAPGALLQWFSREAGDGSINAWSFTVRSHESHLYYENVIDDFLDKSVTADSFC